KPVPAGALAGFHQRPNAPQYHQSDQPPAVPAHLPQPPVVEQPLRRPSLTTPGSDNLSDRAAGGGIAGIALGVASSHDRDSGMQALRGVEQFERSRSNSSPQRRQYYQEQNHHNEQPSY